MQRLDSEIQDVAHQAKVVVRPEDGIWPAVEEAVRDYNTNLIVLGTHGRVGSAKHWLGSIAEEIFRRCTVPVLTIGPSVHLVTSEDDRFHRILFATNFEPARNAAVEYASQFAEENGAQLLLLHVINGRVQSDASVPSVAETMHRLHELVPRNAECRSEAVVRYGSPSKQIVETAKDRCADLIVLGVRDHAENLEYATHFEMTTAHKVVIGAPCPVLTIRSSVPVSDLKPLEGNCVN
jgi:universal stress protein A